MKNLIRLARQGNIDAMVELGERCLKGTDELDYSDTTIANWFKRAAKQGHARGQYYLAQCYEKGFGIAQNYFEAFYWYQRAAEQEHTGAMNAIAYYYYLGRGCEKDYNKTLKWWKKAADLGNAMAIYNLGICYLDGKIVNQDWSEAERFFIKAKELGCEMASKALYNMWNEVVKDDDETFNENETFSYSIDVAAEIYKNLKSQEAANREFYKCLEAFFTNKGKRFECLDGNGIAGFEEIVYKNEEQTISVLMQFNNEPYVSAIMLPTHGEYTQKLFEEGLSNKYLFGLPIFSMQWFDDINRVFIYFMNRESYLKFDTPQGRREKEILGF